MVNETEDRISKFDPRLRKPHGDILEIREDIIGGCQKCGGVGHIDEIACSCMLEMLSICGLDKADCPREYWGYDLHEITTNLAVSLAADVDKYKQTHKSWRSLNKLMLGPYRRGKTTYAVAAMKRYFYGDDRLTGAYITSHQLLTVRNEKDGGKFDLDYLGSLDLLLIDEIGKEPDSGWHRPKFIDALDILLRIRRGSRATVLMGNLQLESFGDEYGDNLKIMLTNDFELMDFSDMPMLGVRSGASV